MGASLALISARIPPRLMTSASLIRNFSIIAHVDHGKSTLADRFLELTGTVEMRRMKPQLLDQMDIERERGITIKLAPVRMKYPFRGQEYVLNLIDTPGHADFTYEVSRSLACVEGAILLVDASQGVQAQTLANLYLALDLNLVIIPVINKIDLPGADVRGAANELAALLGEPMERILYVSAKEGTGVGAVLDAMVERVPSPRSRISEPLQALVFDSQFDEYQGVRASVRVMAGQVSKGDHIRLVHGAHESEVMEVGVFRPQSEHTDLLASGEIGYLITGLRGVEDLSVGDTVINAGQTTPALPGYRALQSMVFSGLYPHMGDEYPKLREALWKLKLSDASLTFEPESNPALGHGFRAGFLGILHLEITRERLSREYGLEVLTTVPSVGYRVTSEDGSETRIIRSAHDLPDASRRARVEEPWVKVDIVTPDQSVGGLMELCASRRGIYVNTEYLKGASSGRAVMHYELPLASILVDFYDSVKSVSQGYASISYEFFAYRPCEVVRIDVLVQEEEVPALSSIALRDEAARHARATVDALKNSIPRQLFTIKLQAAIGGKIIAAERISPLRKDVTKKLSGGDVTRKRKLLEKQKKGKKRLAAHGQVDIPPEAYIAVLRQGTK